MRPPPILPPVERRPKRRRRSFLLSFLGFSFASGVVLFLVGAAVGGYFLWQATSDLPSYDSLAKYEPPVMTRIHAHNGSLISEYAHERRIFVPINTVPKLLIAAYISAEDKRFFEHNGLDFFGIARAGSRFILDKIQGRRRRAEGASTITQQVAKNFLLTSERTADRKLKEAILAVRIERTYSKEKILELYLNQIYLGMNTFGVAAASLTYFNKELKDLTLEEMAYLAALPKGPNNYHPFRKEKEAVARRNAILGLMAENGYITDEEAKTAQAKPLIVNLRPYGVQTHAADYFAEEVFSREPAETQDLLMRLALLETLPLDLCSHIFPDVRAAALLPKLANRNVFVTVAGDARSTEEYRFHPLFSQFLVRRMRSEYGKEAVSAERGRIA